MWSEGAWASDIWSIWSEDEDRDREGRDSERREMAGEVVDDETVVGGTGKLDGA